MLATTAALIACSAGLATSQASERRGVLAAATLAPMSSEADPLGCDLCAAGRSHAEAFIPEFIERPEGLTTEPLDATDVLDYDLDIDVDLVNETITGSNTMTVRSEIDGLNTFTFRLRENFAITGASVNGTPISFDRLNAVDVRAELDRTYDTDEVFELTVSYSGVALSRGFGSIEFGQRSSGRFAATLSQPYYAYTWWPAKDGDFGEPGDNSDKATGSISITAPSEYRATCNGLLQNITSVAGGKTKYTYRTEYQTPTYLYAFAIHPYTTWTQTWNYTTGDGEAIAMPVEFNIYPDVDSTQTRNAAENCIPMLTVFSDLFGVYPFYEEKYGIYNFSFGGGMEHQTNSGQSSFGESLTAHELGHQWWGDHVTCKSWDDIWLNEGFATYCESLWLEFKNGQSHTALVNAMNNRRPGAGGANDVTWVADTDSLGAIFDGSTSYRKGGWIYHMLRGVLGDEDFFAMLRDVRENFGFGTWTTANLRDAAEVYSPIDLGRFFDQWVYEGGHLELASSFENVTIDGQPYARVRLRQTQSTSYPTYDMPIDLLIRTAPSATRARVRFDERSEHFLIPVDGPVTRVTLDPDTWILHYFESEESYVAGPPRIAASSIEPGDILNDAPAAITLTFSDAGVSPSPSHFTLSGPEGVVPTSLAMTSPFTAELTPAAPLAPGAYTLTVSDAISANGLPLDGEILPSVVQSFDGSAFPSGDGQAGGAAVISFEIDGGCSASDLAEPFGSLDIADVVAFLSAFGSADPAADLAEPFGTLDIADVVAFLNLFGAGCP
ncbi:MAG: hypothetical protein CMJ31_10290 [Phycisphaerae bacterium]|nr:hypothetical protein [Phycisphaerae bacterium]